MGWSAPQPGAPRQSRRSRGPAAADRNAAAQSAMRGPGGPGRREGCIQDGSLGSRATERAACAAAPFFGTTAKRPLLLRDTRRRDALVAAKATAAAVAARLNVGSAASPQPGRRSPCPGRRPSRRCPQPRQISGMGSSGRRRRLAPRPQRSLQRRGRSARRWHSHQPSCRCSHFARSRAVLATF